MAAKPRKMMVAKAKIKSSYKILRSSVTITHEPQTSRPQTRESYSVEMDERGHIVIPSALRKAKGFGAHTLFVLFPDGDELRLIPGEVKPKRELRMYSNHEIAQSLIDGAVTPAGLEDAKDGIRELGLNPEDYIKAL